VVLFPGEETDFPVLRRVQTGTGAQPSFYSKGNGGDFLGRKAAAASS